MISAHAFINCDKCTAMVWDADDGGGHTREGVGGQ